MNADHLVQPICAAEITQVFAAAAAWIKREATQSSELDCAT
jgi:hypothetical protein